MGTPHTPEPVILFCGLIASDAAVLDQVIELFGTWFGKVLLRSPSFPFDFTDYYEREMGRGLVRQFVAFAEETDAGHLSGIKLKTNALEQELAVQSADGRVRRRVNIDPGYVAPDKVVLATTKNCAHRIYLSNGIYAEVTLNFGKSTVRAFEWTYPDYRTPIAKDFFLTVRHHLLRKRRERRADAVPPCATPQQ
ncbi:MAG: DUF4416 family protein [Kiritimatiellia bacterium]